MSWDPDADAAPPHAPTEIDSDSDVEVSSGEEDVPRTLPADIPDLVIITGPVVPPGIITGPGVPPAIITGPVVPPAPLISADSVGPYRRWARMEEVIWKCSFLDNLYWALAAPGVDVQQHIDFMLNDTLSARLGHFKIGITYLPHDRIFTYCGYARPDRRMYVVAVSEQPQVIADYEDDAIARYSPLHSPSGGHPGCHNRSRGELGAYHGMSPFFLYIVIGNAHGWEETGRCNLRARPWVPHFAAWSDRMRSATVSTDHETAFRRRLELARERTALRSRSPPTAPEPA